jgi:TolB-like protein
MFDTLGHYKILDRIGAGGMGEVYRARDTRLGRTVAIKVMAATVAGDADRRERFLREARATAALSHPNIAALYEIGEDQGQLFLVFEFVPGEPLSSVIAGRPLNLRRAVDFATQVADALADAHGEGIVHRDIKPANIIITPKDKAKILDFGLAAWTAGGAERVGAHDSTVLVTAAGTTLGTAAYMSPEQALGEKVDQRTDIFSLGIVLFEMVTGRLPFSGATPTAVSMQIVQATAPKPSSVNPALPPEVDVIAGRALSKSLNSRYESAATMAAELRSLAAILDVRSEVSEAAAPALASSRRGGSGLWWLMLLVLLGALVAAAWFERTPLQRLWRRTLGPAPAPVIAVIPFETDANQTVFADGLVEDLITRLGQTPGLKVIGRSASRNFRGRAPRDVARELGAAVVLTGSVRPSPEAVKVSVELIDPADETAIWSNQYTREVKDVFAVQAQIAEDVARALKVTLQPTASAARASARTVDPRAYDLYVRGRQALVQRRPAEAISLYDQAIAVDAGLAEAFAGIAEAIEFATITSQRIDSSMRQRLEAAADRAYQLDPDSPQANLAKGLSAPGLASALGFLRRAVELDPSYGEGLHQIGDQILDFDPARAIEFYRASLAVDPLLEPGHTDIANALISTERWDEARREVDAVRVEPFDGWRVVFHVLIDLNQGQPEVALSRLDKTVVPAPFGPAIRARVLATLGRSKEALQELGRLRPPIAGTCMVRALSSGLRRDIGDGAGGRQLVAETMAAARDEHADPETVRCAAMAAAALGDAATAREILLKITGREDLLRYWALQIAIDRGSTMLRGRYYPWNRVAEAPQLTEARERLATAYAHEREIAATALAGLP